MTASEIRSEIRATRAEMRAKGIRRLSCFNAGHSADSYRLNARMFELEYRLKVITIVNNQGRSAS